MPLDADPTVPLVLLPVRLETRYTQDGRALRVRLYPDDIHLDTSGQAAFVRLLPDAFTVVVVQGRVRGSATGKTIRAELLVGLFPADGSPLRVVHGLKLPAGAEWVADYGAAESAGMAVTVPLPRPGARIDRVLAFGVRGSLDPAASAAALQAQLDVQRRTQGLAFVPQGTPTNNTEDARSGWQRGEPPAPDTTAPDATAPAAPAAGSNAAVLAHALGIDAVSLAGLRDADGREQPLAQAMNVATWGPSWGSFLRKIARPVNSGRSLTDSGREAARRLHRDHVRGRGPLPALRVGDQPYGLLPVSRLSALAPEDGFEREVKALLERLRQRWRQCLPRVPRIGQGDPAQTLLELLGSSAVCLALTVRPVVASPLALIGAEVGAGDAATLAVERMIEDLLWEELNSAGLTHPAGSFGKARVLSLPLVHETDGAFIDALLAGGDADAASVFQALLGLAWDEARRAVEADSGGGRLSAVAAYATALDSAARERMLATALHADTATPAALQAEATRAIAGLPGGVPDHMAYQPVRSVAKSFSELALASTHAQSRAQLAQFGLHAWFGSRARLAELREALQALRTTELAERELLLAESLDTASHRLDAWITALVDRRLQRLRERTPAGCTLGAYGWVEGLAPPGGTVTESGYIHAPGLAHASTAAILRSAYLAHNTGADGDGAFAVDLTSARVRTALHLIDGVRQGQPLGALLGYRIERGLQDAGLGRFVLTLRGLAPLAQGALGDAAASVEPSAGAEANVLDGIALIEQVQGKVAGRDAAALRLRLSATPTANPYLSGAWTPPTDAEWARLLRIVQAEAAALDAVADLKLAESVHMLVAGNPARAAAVLDAMSGGDTPDPDPEVVRTPVDAAYYTHRLLLLAGDAPGWNSDRPRAAAEPRLEAWAAARLGDRSTIACGRGQHGAFVTLADTGLCALDLVHDSASDALWQGLIASALPAGATTLEPGADPGGLRHIGDVRRLAQALRSLLVKARPATGADLALAHAPAQRAIGQVELAEARGRIERAIELMELRRTRLEALRETVPPDLPAIRTAMQDLAAFGLPAPVGEDARALETTSALHEADAARRIDTARRALATGTGVDAVAEAGQAIFGEGFWVLPALALPAESDDWSAARTTPPAKATRAEVGRFLADHAAVRDGVRRHADALLLQEAIGVPAPLQVAQLAGGQGRVPTGWVGAPMPLDEPTPDASVLSVIVDAHADVDSTPCAGLVVDEWVERMPLRKRRGAAEDAPVDERVTSGITFNAASPSARAPQAILLAVSPDGARWTADTLAQTLEETLELAQQRAVTLERTNGIARILPALFMQSHSLQGEKVLDLEGLVGRLTDRIGSIAWIKEA